MYSVADLPPKIPVFPLPGAILLPRARLPLHIFEPRYLVMLDDVLKSSDRLIGMVQPIDASGASDRLYDVGCAGRLTAFSETDDGRYLITLSGISRFRIIGENPDFSPYRKCDVSWQDFDSDLGAGVRLDEFDRDKFFHLLNRYFEMHDLGPDLNSFNDAGDEFLINSLAMLCPFEHEDKQALLEAGSLQLRKEIVVTLLEFGLRGGSTEKAMQ